MNTTITNFDYPNSLIKEYDHWVVLLRPAQATLGALILACKDDVESFSQISAAAGAELPAVIRHLEPALAQSFGYSKLNYLMLMMVDPHVHFHVLPRYSAAQTHAGLSFEDPGWPGPPKITESTATDAAMNQQLIALIQSNWG